MAEVYNEAVFDLLVSPDDGHEKLQIVKKGKETVVQVRSPFGVQAPPEYVPITQWIQDSKKKL